eukprot:10026267-Alexandrium_andersonii.AAC.1
MRESASARHKVLDSCDQAVGACRRAPPDLDAWLDPCLLALVGVPRAIATSSSHAVGVGARKAS